MQKGASHGHFGAVTSAFIHAMPATSTKMHAIRRGPAPCSGSQDEAPAARRLQLNSYGHTIHLHRAVRADSTLNRMAPAEIPRRIVIRGLR